MKIADLMTRHVEFIEPDATAQDAASLMGELDVCCHEVANFHLPPFQRPASGHTAAISGTPATTISIESGRPNFQ